MSGFTKLVPEIVHSSIWNESAEIRCVWIAMIATKDKHGYIRGNSRSLARLANVSDEAAKEALKIFQEPDDDSNNPEQEGRRIEAVPGGWHIISHDLYRAREYNEVEAERKKNYREKKRMSRTCPGHVADSSVSVSSSSSASGKEGGAGEEKQKAVKRKAYGEFGNVKLSEDEHAKLTKQQGAAKLARGIGELDDYIQAGGKRYKSHYAVLKPSGWVWAKIAQPDASKPGPARQNYVPQFTQKLANHYQDPIPDETMRKAF